MKARKLNIDKCSVPKKYEQPPEVLEILEILEIS